MNTSNAELENSKINIKFKLMGLWITLMLLYIYADLFSFYRPGYISEVIAGFIGPLSVNQITLAASSVLMLIPAFMIIVCLFIKANALRWINIVIGALYTLVGIGNLAGEVWVYYLMYGIAEIFITITIMILAFKWPRRE